jgi:RNA polymerase sigma-70 factor (ECF subfamily)
MGFEDLYTRHYSGIYSFAYRLTGMSEDALDITQDVFIKVFCSLQRGTVLENPKAWIYKIAANSCYTHLRREKHFKGIVRRNPETVVSPAANPDFLDAEAQRLRDEERRRVRTCFNRLPPKDRLLLELYQQGFNYTEMADILKLKKSTLGKKIFRAREKLTHMLTQEGAHEMPVG